MPDTSSRHAAGSTRGIIGLMKYCGNEELSLPGGSIPAPAGGGVLFRACRVVVAGASGGAAAPPPPAPAAGPRPPPPPPAGRH